jgi:hypothetical protein
LNQQNGGSSSTAGLSVRNGGAGMRGLEKIGESPPPEYNVVVLHENIRHGFFFIISLFDLIFFYRFFNHF